MGREYLCDKCGKRVRKYYEVTGYPKKDGITYVFARTYDSDSFGGTFILCNTCFNAFRDGLWYRNSAEVVE